MIFDLNSSTMKAGEESVAARNTWNSTTTDDPLYDSSKSDTTSNETSDDINFNKLTQYPDVTTASYIGVLVLLGVLTNGVVFYVYLRLMSGSVIARPFQPFIVTMSSADLLCCLVGFPIDMFIILTPGAPSRFIRLWVFSSVVISVCTTLDVFSLVALNTISYFSVMYPSRTIGRKAIITGLVATLMMSCVVNVPFIFMHGVVMISSSDDHMIFCENHGLAGNVYIATQLMLYTLVMICLMHQDIKLACYICQLTHNGRLLTVMSRRLPVSGISRTVMFGTVRRSLHFRHMKTSDAYRISSRQNLIASFHRDLKNSKNSQSLHSPAYSPEIAPASHSANKFVLVKDPRIREERTPLTGKMSSAAQNAKSKDFSVHNSPVLEVSSKRRGKSVVKENDEKEEKDKGKGKKSLKLGSNERKGKSVVKENDEKEEKDKGKGKKSLKLGSKERKGKNVKSPRSEITVPIRLLAKHSQVETPAERSRRSFQRMWAAGRHPTSFSALEFPGSKSSPFRVLRRHVKVKIKNKTVMPLGITAAMFFVTYTPFVVLLALCHNMVFIPTNRSELSAVEILQRSTYILIALNAIIYNLFNKGFWHRVRLHRRRFFRQFCCKE